MEGQLRAVNVCANLQKPKRLPVLCLGEVLVFALYVPPLLHYLIIPCSPFSRIWTSGALVCRYELLNTFQSPHLLGLGSFRHDMISNVTAARTQIDSVPIKATLHTLPRSSSRRAHDRSGRMVLFGTQVLMSLGVICPLIIAP
jgi:hypothetical protein